MREDEDGVSFGCGGIWRVESGEGGRENSWGRGQTSRPRRARFGIEGMFCFWAESDGSGDEWRVVIGGVRVGTLEIEVQR